MIGLAHPEIVIEYNPRGACSDIFKHREPELVIAGPAGTGKSRAILEKLHLMALKYPQARILMLRKTRRRLTESGMVTYWQKIGPNSMVCSGSLACNNTNIVTVPSSPWVAWIDHQDHVVVSGM